MSSTIFSRFASTAAGPQSIYETLRQHENEIDEQNLDERFHDQDLDDLLAEAAQSGVTTESTPFVPPPRAPQPLPPPVPGPSLPYSDSSHPPAAPRRRHLPQNTGLEDPAGIFITNPAEKALWRWTNVVNLDSFLVQVYDYYLGKGIWSIVLSRALGLLTFAFVGVLLSFLTFCVDYAGIPHSRSLHEVMVPQCTQKINGIGNILIWLVSFLWFWKLIDWVKDIRRLWHMHEFYFHLLGVHDSEMQTISWQTVVGRLMNLRDANPRTATNLTPQARQMLGENSKQRMDAHDIANRIMRRENYLIAMFNKEILDLSLPIPFLGNHQLFSKTLQWNMQYCVMDPVFNEQGQVKQLFLKDSHRKELAAMLTRRFIFAGYMNAIFAPFLAFVLIAFYILRFFIEFQKNPAAIGARAYTPLAEWKFREFNEVWHLFERRIDMSYPFASRYIDQFPKDKTVQIAKFVAFIAGALGAVLAIASLLDPDLFLGFEITHDRTVLFYLGILGTIWAVTRGVVPEENQVFDPEYAIQNVIEFTHYQPASWEGRLHSDEVRQEFAQLYQPKVLTFLEEILSIISTPYILWFCLPRCSTRIVDFFREFTVHVDGLGYVCSFALFEFEKGAPGAQQRAASGAKPSQDAREDYYAAKDNKMLTSYYNFLDSYGNNPRRAVPREIGRRAFHPPPAFPGLQASQMTVKEAVSDRRVSPVRPKSVPRTTVQEVASSEPAFNASPSPSLLLDPRHQPTMSLEPRRPHKRGPSQLRYAGHTEHRYVSHPLDEESAASRPSSAGQGLEESRLGESWKTTQGTMHEDEAGTDIEDLQPEGGAGVLGLIYQFQKAQTEGRAGIGL